MTNSFNMNNMTKQNKEKQSLSYFTPFVDEIESFICSLLKKRTEKENELFSLDLNGKITDAFHNLVPLSVRKKSGLFFTDTILSQKAVNRIKIILDKGKSVVDPACGIGNLLASCAKYLPRGGNVNETLKIWSELIHGYDVHEEFIRMTKLHLFLAATQLHKKHNLPIFYNRDDLFKGIQLCNTLSLSKPTHQIDCVVINPPYGYIKAPDNCSWAAGKIQTAALFLEKLLVSAHAGQHMVAILPDVLRSGSRYHKWRKIIEENSMNLDIELVGRFDRKTDVDVFILHVVKGKAKQYSTDWYMLNELKNNEYFKLKDLFNVMVGPVVPYRNPEKGKFHPYLDCSSAIPWSILNKLPRRRFSGTVINPPFVVMRRTSNPKDKSRSISTIINCNKPVAVENHLIIIKPKNGTLKLCKNLIEILKLPKTKEWFDKRIRCRHLTVSAVKELPWWKL